MERTKINVEVICPAVSGRYDFVIDKQMTAGEAAEKIASQIREYEKTDVLFTKGNVLLYSSGSRLPLSPSVPLEEYGVTGGSRLMIIQEGDR